MCWLSVVEAIVVQRRGGGDVERVDEGEEGREEVRGGSDGRELERVRVTGSDFAVGGGWVHGLSRAVVGSCD